MNQLQHYPIRRFFSRALGRLLLACAYAACAGPATQPAYSTEPVTFEEDEAAAIEAAKRHPIATLPTRPLYPEQAPPPTAATTTPLEPAQPTNSSVLATPNGEAIEGDDVVAPAPPPATDYVVVPPSAAPAPEYVWAPGYWYWLGGHFVWIPGEWLAPRPGFVYIAPAWRWTVLGWTFRLGGWARGGSAIIVHRLHPRGYRDPAWDARPRTGWFAAPPPRPVPLQIRRPRGEVHVTPGYRGREPGRVPSARVAPAPPHAKPGASTAPRSPQTRAVRVPRSDSGGRSRVQVRVRR